MDEKEIKLLKTLKGKKVGVFCDDSNLYHAYKKYGWKINFEKFRKLLEKYCDLIFIHYHIAIPDKSDDVFKGTEDFLSKIDLAVILKKKLIKYTPVAGKFMKKADVDVEIVLDVVRNIEDLDVIIILSGDSDLLELKNYIVNDKRKSIIFWAYEKNMAWELKYCWHLYLDDYRKEIELGQIKPPGFIPG